MIIIKCLLFIILFNLLTIKDLYSSSLSTDEFGEKVYNDVQLVFRKIRNDIVTELDNMNKEHKIQGKRISNTVLIIDNNNNNLFESVSYNTNTIILSKGFIINLWKFSKAYIMELDFNKKHFIKKYYKYMRNKTLYMDRTVDGILKYANLSASEKDKWHSEKNKFKIKQMFQAGLTFVLAHELGHIAENRFNKVTDLEDEILLNEKAADRWACEYLSRIGIRPFYGAVIANGVFFMWNYYSLIFPENIDSTHPHSIERLISSLESSITYFDLMFEKRYEYFKNQKYSKEFYLNDLNEKKKFYIKFYNDYVAQTINPEYYKILLETKNDNMAAYILGNMYEYGNGVNKDVNKAFKYYTVSAQMGYKPAFSKLGYCYFQGVGTKIDLAKSVQSYRKALYFGLKEGFLFFYRKKMFNHIQSKINNHEFNKWLNNRNSSYSLANLKKLQLLNLNNYTFRRFPKKIFTLNNIKILYLNNNKISKLPTEIKYLNNLEQLHLSKNHISNLPSEVKFLKNLTVLNLGYNNFFQFPNEILELNKLEELFLNANKINKIPSNIDNLNNLFSIRLDNNNLSQLPVEFKNLKNLEILNLRRNKFVNLPKEILYLKQLRILNLEYNQLSKIPVGIENLVNLKELILSGNQIKHIPTEIQKLKNLKLLVLNKDIFLDKKNISKLLPNTKIMYK